MVNYYTTANRAVILKKDESTLILLNKHKADVTSPIHEIAHKYEDVLTEDEVKTLEKWSGFKKGSSGFREAFAKGAEKFIYEGVTFNGKIDEIFKKFKEWFRNVIDEAINYFGDINELNEEVRDIYRKMLIDDYNTALPNTPKKENLKRSSQGWDSSVEATAKALESKKEEELNKILPERERLSHRIVKDEYTTTADDMTKGGNLIPNDFYQHPEYYADLSDPNYKESWDAIKKIKGNPDAEITIYRSAPNGSAIEEGDWISLSKKYAKQEGEHPTDESQDLPVISMKVKAKEIVWDGNDINEFAYYPEKSESKADKISKAYHKAKADGSNPELVKAVEKLLGNPTEQQKTETRPRRRCHRQNCQQNR